MSDTLSKEALSALRLQAVKYMNSAATAILLFDYALTFHLEVDLIWPSKWSPAKIIFLLARYTPFLDVPLQLYYSTARMPFKRCAQVNFATSYSTILGLAMSEAIFVLRTYALSGRRQKIIYIFGAIYLICVLAIVVMMSVLLRYQSYSVFPLGLGGCNLTGGPIILAGLAFILLLINETALMSYTLWLGFKLYRHSSSQLVETLYRDGIMYFVFLCLGSAANVVLLVAAPVRHSQIILSQTNVQL
ncbi:hypothetical protein B0H16DRAFT_293030 [Mycena metata]|uniref:DUF6533 domain-containing protein n=1 Tax=Mycena metata TaxID=1033252 RepID=A0AAD7P196_9AGAR|nr:hypothetical protein B0H16DRAFT_293030 [Mycena metata]